jgi:hypothetical protein
LQNADLPAVISGKWMLKRPELRALASKLGMTCVRWYVAYPLSLRHLAHEAMAAADHPHHLESLDRSGRGLPCLKAAGRTDDSFECSVISLDDVIKVLVSTMLCRACQRAFSLQSADRFRIRTELVCRDRRRRPMVHRRSCFAQETMSSAGVSPV